MLGVQVEVTVELPPWLRISGSVKSWSEPMTVKSDTIANEARIKGSLMPNAVRHSPAPSMVAASRTERSMAWSAA